jgi:hypothetical protein
LGLGIAKNTVNRVSKEGGVGGVRNKAGDNEGSQLFEFTLKKFCFYLFTFFSFAEIELTFSWKIYFICEKKLSRVETA